MIAAAHAACDYRTADTLRMELEIWEEELATLIAARWLKAATSLGTWREVPAAECGDSVFCDFPDGIDYTCPRKIDVHVEIEPCQIYRDCIVSLELVAVHPICTGRRHMEAEYRVI